MPFRENRFYFILTLIFILTHLIVAIAYPGIHVILKVVSWRMEPFDEFFAQATKIGEAYTYIVAFAAFLFIRYRISILILGLSLTNLGLSYLLKVLFSHPRPYTLLESLSMQDKMPPIEGVRYMDGFHSFPSGHTLSAFALFGFLTLISRSNVTKIMFPILACLVGISRIYLGQHFPKDVCAGAITGTIIALIFYQLNQIFMKFGNSHIGYRPIA